MMGVCPTLCAGMTHGNTISYVIVSSGEKNETDKNR